MLVTVTFAFGTTACEGSRTTPVSVARSTCATAPAAKTNNRAATRLVRWMNRDMLVSPRSREPFSDFPEALHGPPTGRILSSTVIQIGNAPCSWGILEFAGEAVAAPYPTVLDEIRETGYAGTELGDWGFMPTDPLRLSDELARRRLQLVGAFVPVALADAATHDKGMATAVRT